MAHLSAQLAELVLLPAPVTLLEMSDCVGAVSYIVALVAKGTSSVAIFFPYNHRKELGNKSCKAYSWKRGQEYLS